MRYIDDPSILCEHFNSGKGLTILCSETVLLLKDVLGFQFREAWEGDPMCAKIVPSSMRGQGLIGNGLYCREHKIIVIPIEHPLVPEAKTLVVERNASLPSCSIEAIQQN